MTKNFNLADFPTEETVTILSNFLEHLIRVNEHLVPPSTVLSGSPVCPAYTPFHAKSLPNISIHLYLSRILKYCPCNNECFLALLVYFDRMAKFRSQTHPQERPFAIDAYNVHRIVIVGIMIASKFFSDVYYTNVRYAKVGGLPVKELNDLELEFLYLIQYEVNISVNELQIYANQLLNYTIDEKSATTMSTDEKLPKLLISNQPVSTTSVTDVHAIRTDTVQEPIGNLLEQKIYSKYTLAENKRLARSPANLIKCEAISQSPRSKFPLNIRLKSRLNKWPHESVKNWCHTKLPSQRTANGEILGQISSVY